MQCTYQVQKSMLDRMRKCRLCEQYEKSVEIRNEGETFSKEKGQTMPLGIIVE